MPTGAPRFVGCPLPRPHPRRVASRRVEVTVHGSDYVLKYVAVRASLAPNAIAGPSAGRTAFRHNWKHRSSVW
jgi:hypothetical protein